MELHGVGVYLDFALNQVATPGFFQPVF
jgi:hypothetical protein